MANTKIPKELSSTPSIVDNGNATAITIDTSENVTLASGLDVNGVVDLNNLTVNTAQGTDGQVLTSTGSGIAWEDASGGGGGGGSGGLSGGTSVYMHNGWSNQSITKNVVTKILMDAVEFGNSQSAYNTTNKEYTVPSAGQYLFLGNIATDYYSVPASTQVLVLGSIYKNGSEVFQQADPIRLPANTPARDFRFQVRIMKVLNLAQNDVIDFRARLSHYGNGANTIDITRGYNYSGSTYIYIIKLQ